MRRTRGDGTRPWREMGRPPAGAVVAAYTHKGAGKVWRRVMQWIRVPVRNKEQTTRNTAFQRMAKHEIEIGAKFFSNSRVTFSE